MESEGVQRKLVSGIMGGLLTIVIGVFAVVTGLGVLSCFSDGTAQIDHYTQQAVKYVPPGATDIEPLSKGWVKYTYDGHRYLFLFHYWSHGGYAAVTRIDWDDTTKAGAMVGGSWKPTTLVVGAVTQD